MLLAAIVSPTGRCVGGSEASLILLAELRATKVVAYVGICQHTSACISVQTVETNDTKAHAGGLPRVFCVTGVSQFLLQVLQVLVLLLSFVLLHTLAYTRAVYFC